MPDKKTPHLLIVLDGFGYSEQREANAIALANTPVWDQLWAERAHTLIDGSGHAVGLPSGQMGNSEVGHMNLGAGRVVDQDFTRITKAMADGSFATNPVISDTFSSLAASGATLHLLGLLSPGGVHSHEEHIHAAIRAAHDAGVKRIRLHAFLDGRDVPPKSAEPSLTAAADLLASTTDGAIGSIMGRFYAMDRDNRWDRVAAAWETIVSGESVEFAADAVAGLKAAYARDETDEFVAPTVIGEAGASAVQDGDAIIFMNFRADRAREITRAFVTPGFEGFTRSRVPALDRYVMLTEYAADIDAPVAYPPAALNNGLGEYVAGLGLRQLRIAETEKYAHVTFFFSCGREEPFAGEDRVLVPSPQVKTYDLQPEMSAPEVTDKLVAAITNREYDLIICNFANGDMVGHTGVLPAAIEAVECLDACLGRIVSALEKVDGHCLITADHGNVEKMSDAETSQPHTAHTTELVPLVYVGNRHITLAAGGVLSDIAPTLIALMDLPQPVEMTGRSLLEQPLTQAASS